MLRTERLLVGAALCLGLASCSEPAQLNAPGGAATDASVALAKASATPTDDYIILMPAGVTVPASLAAAVTAAGGTLTASFPEIGVAVAKSTSANFAKLAGQIRGIQSVQRDQMLQWTDPNPRVESIDLEATGVVANATGTAETFSPIQWAPGAVSAPQAWAAGYRGHGARVAIVDGGLYNSHIDLTANVDVAHSASFVPGFAFNQDVGTFWHGTHVAGIVAAAANDIGIAGIAPEATLVGVKVLHNGSGSFSWVINGIIYAATPIAEGGAGANIINLSLGALFDRQGAGAAQLAVALSRATTYARQRGALVIAAAGNDTTDLDHTNNLISVPAQSAGVLSISALAPVGWALDQSTSRDLPTTYTNFGQSAITFGAPGGDFAYPGNEVCTFPRLNPPPPPASQVITNPCWVFDGVFSAARGLPASVSNYAWASGTSMAAPAAAGVAALIVGKYGPMPPAQLEAKLRASADDLGKPGNDDFYGAGRVNAYRAVTE